MTDSLDRPSVSFDVRSTAFEEGVVIRCCRSPSARMRVTDDGRFSDGVVAGESSGSSSKRAFIASFAPNSMPVRTSPPRQQGGRKSRRSSGNFSRRYAPAGPAAGIAPQELARPPCSPVCARSGDHSGAPLNDAVSSEGRCVRFLTAKLCERAPSAQIQRTHFLGLAPTGPHRANFPPRITRAATAQAAAADLISGTRDRTRACCAVTAAPATSKMRGNCRNVATG